MSYTNLEIITASYRILTVIDEITEPSAEQGVAALVVLNDLMADMNADGIRMGWYPQTSTADDAPLEDADARNIKVLLAQELALHFGIEPSPMLNAEAKAVYEALAKRYLHYVESDLTTLPFSQGGLFGPGRV